MPQVNNYLDDILVATQSEQERRHVLDNVLSRLEDAGVRLKTDKCTFMTRSVNYLGYVIDEQGLQQDPINVRQSVKESPEPKDVTELRIFLGLINYYNRFMLNLANILASLYHLVRKGAK